MSLRESRYVSVIGSDLTKAGLIRNTIFIGLSLDYEVKLNW